ncbi:hypothetical protein BCR34DRAFT_576209 [Clohesyomyces aquaticus]|uniref:Uncharacterized protein n=1 Tax=Clohesyomyces aquaticus TaxID=1231657 RepID=A0A1Y1YPP3_9PLEO|nr:hypothetical protein BCR34DRAFT_576209 [Clohesyomyces aquaticus]
MVHLKLLSWDGVNPPVYEISKNNICQPPCSCTDCQLGYYMEKQQYNPSTTYMERVPDNEAKSRAKTFVQEALEARDFIKGRLKGHADLLMNRWKKKSQVKRAELLREAAWWLDEEQWIVPRYGYMPERRLAHARERVRRLQLLLPWLNIEVLKANPAVLLALLHYRTVFPPQDWATFDSRQHGLSWTMGWLNVDFSSKCIVMHGPQYGSVIAWDGPSHHRGDILGYPRAILILEAQSLLLTFLRNVTDKLLQGIDESQPPQTQKWSNFLMTGFRRTGEIESWAPYPNQAFSPPPNLNFDYLISLAQTRLDSMNDHLVGLQNDPKYFRYYIKSLLGSSLFKVIKKDEAAGCLVRLIFHEIQSYHWWKFVEIEFQHAQKTHIRFRDNVYCGQALPRPYDRALGALELFLVNQVILRATLVGELLPLSSGFAEYWTLSRSPTDVRVMEAKLKTPVNTVEHFREDPLHWCLAQMQGKPDDLQLFDHAFLFAFLQDHLAKSSPKELSRIDASLMHALSDLSTAHEMLVSVRLHRPQNAIRSIDDCKVTEQRESWKEYRHEHHHPTMQEMSKLGTNLMARFYKVGAPSGPRNLVWLKKAQESRAAQESFWAGMRKIFERRYAGSTLTEQELSGLLQILSISSTPEYLEAVQEEERRFQTEASETNQTLESFIPSDKESVAGPKLQLPLLTAKDKKKTRPQGATEKPKHGDDLAVESIPPHEPELKPIVSTKRALHVFSLMFSDSKEDASRSVIWNDFVQAMTDVGFSARNSGGSAVLFDHVHEGGKIVFHRPHPVAEIDPIMLRSMGKRMAKWFGWSGERFVLEGA